MSRGAAVTLALVAALCAPAAAWADDGDGHHDGDGKTAPQQQQQQPRPSDDGRPDDKASPFGDPLQDALFDQFRIEVPVMPWPSPPKRLLRISAQLYNSIDQYSKLADALCRLL